MTVLQCYVPIDVLIYPNLFEIPLKEYNSFKSNTIQCYDLISSLAEA